MCDVWLSMTVTLQRQGAFECEKVVWERLNEKDNKVEYKQSQTLLQVTCHTITE